MSAWLCSPYHLSALVNIPRDFRGKCDEGADTIACSWTKKFDAEDEVLRALPGTAYDTIFRALLRENLASLNGRYPKNTKAGNTPADWYDGDYRYNPSATCGTHAAAIKAIQCYQYQSCEHGEAWKNSVAYAYCQEMTELVATNLPGYDEAPWALDEPVKVTP